jgi:hypothetical protein
MVPFLIPSTSSSVRSPRLMQAMSALGHAESASEPVPDSRHPGRRRRAERAGRNVDSRDQFLSLRAELER